MIDNLIGPHLLNGSYIMHDKTDLKFGKLDSSILDLCSGILGAIATCNQHLGLHICVNQHMFLLKLQWYSVRVSFGFLEFKIF